MKFKLIGLLLISSLFGCREAIKHDVKFVAEQDFEDIQCTEPKVSNSLVVNTKEDLLGYWVGDFDANLSDEEMDTIYGNESYSNLITRKITFSIDEIKGDSIIGDSILKGNWEAYSQSELKIYKRNFDLKKKLFVYDKAQELDVTFFDTDKSKEYVYATDTVDGKVEEYIDNEYYATTEKLFEKNASNEVLTTDFVSNLSKADIFILRNSIFARHGFAFRDKQLRMYFEQFNWYMPVFGDVKDELTEIEKENIDLLLRYEKNAEEYYDTFGR